MIQAQSHRDEMEKKKDRGVWEGIFTILYGGDTNPKRRSVVLGRHRWDAPNTWSQT